MDLTTQGRNPFQTDDLHADPMIRAFQSFRTASSLLLVSLIVESVFSPTPPEPSQSLRYYRGICPEVRADLLAWSAMERGPLSLPEHED